MAAAANAIVVYFGSEKVETDIDEGEAMFRQRGAIQRFFVDQAVNEGDLVLIRRIADGEFQVSKVAKRIFNNYL